MQNMSSNPKKVLVIFAHPTLHRSVVNKQMLREIQGMNNVTVNDLYENYPDFNIDIRREQKLLTSHDIIVFQHPFYWYNTPSIIKEWCDLVLEYGFAYGDGGDLLKGKPWIHAITTGGTKAAYTSEGHNRFTVREFLAPYEQTACLCEMQFMDPFVIHGSYQLDSKTTLPEATKAYRKFMEGLTHGTW